jgi:hypothetical protein
MKLMQAATANQSLLPLRKRRSNIAPSPQPGSAGSVVAGGYKSKVISLERASLSQSLPAGGAGGKQRRMQAALAQRRAGRAAVLFDEECDASWNVTQVILPPTTPDAL